jgi:hypothetical protein
MYKTEEDFQFVACMGQVLAIRSALAKELREEYFAIFDDDRKALRRKRRLLKYWKAFSNQYLAYEKMHKDKFGERNPASAILEIADELAELKREEIVQFVLQDIKNNETAKIKAKKVRMIRHVTCETDDEAD